MAASDRSVGIDLGTTNSLVAFMQGDIPVIIPGEDGSNLGPSVVALDENDRIIVGNAARKYLIETPKRSVYSIKRLMGRGLADLVLVDAPCSGSGTWRRNPEGRWRLTPERLDRVIALQQRLLVIAAELVVPGGRLVYAVCSLLSREGAGQIEDFLARHSSWISQETPIAAGRLDGAGRLLTPGHDHTDGFFVARLGRPC